MGLSVIPPFQHSERGGLHFKDSSLLILEEEKKKTSYGVMDCLVPFNPHHAKTILVFVFAFEHLHYHLQGCALQLQDGRKFKE